MDRLKDICAKLQQGHRLTRADALALWESNEILSMGTLAREVAAKKNGNYVYFNRNRHINLTNICHSQCKFCAFGKKEDHPEAYVMSVSEVVDKALEGARLGITELHVVSALHPKLPFSYYLDITEKLHDALPHIHIQGFTAAEIKYLSQISGLSVTEVLGQLVDAGLGSLPGGGAEIFSPRVRQMVCPHKLTGQEWLDVMSTAHKLGLRSNATMLYGHVETIEERTDHLLALRQLQDETGGFQSFIPLRFHPSNTQLEHITPTTAIEDLKVLAIARLILDNFTHIKAFWIMLGIAVAQISLEFGVDDLDGTVVEERITHAAGATTAKGITVEELLGLIRATKRVPVERDTLYNVLKVYDEA